MPYKDKFYIIKDEIFILEQDKINIISKYELNNNMIDLLKLYINYVMLGVGIIFR